jgi:hypothetical protein
MAETIKTGGTLPVAKETLRYFYDYGRCCLWANDGGIRHEELPLTHELVCEINKLCDEFDTSIDWDYPPDPSPWSAEHWTDFVKRAHEVGERISRQLAPHYTVQNLIDKFNSYSIFCATRVLHEKEYKEVWLEVETKFKPYYSLPPLHKKVGMGRSRMSGLLKDVLGLHYLKLTAWIIRHVGGPPLVQFSQDTTYKVYKASIWDEQQEKIVNDIFKKLCKNNLYALDWQHDGFIFNPKGNIKLGTHWHDSKRDVEVYFPSYYPDGDYHFFLATDFTYGLFGHPWKEEIYVFGDNLVKEFENSAALLELEEIS